MSSSSAPDSSSSSDGSKWIVALADDAFRTAADRGSKTSIVSVRDPSTDEPRNYLRQQHNQSNNTAEMIEIQTLPADFAAFFVGRHVVSDSSLYVLNRMDPLFWILSLQSTDETIKRSWQPFDQIKGQFSPEIQAIVPPATQFPHLFSVMCNDQTDNVAYYKFSPSKAVRWLQRKQEAVYQHLLTQEQARLEAKQKEQEAKVKTNGGSTSSSFYVPEDDLVSAAPTTSSKSTSSSIQVDTETIKVQSLQILSAYLTKEWTQKLLESLKLSESTVLLEPKETKKKIDTTTTPPLASSSSSSASSKSNIPDKPTSGKIKVNPKETPRTASNKRLAKVNTKGMKSMSSFFGVAPSKKKKIQ